MPAKRTHAIGERPWRKPGRPSAYRRETEEQIVVKARAGDQAAMGQLLAAHDSAMRALAWKILGDQNLMDDALQDAYLSACRSIDGFRGDSQFGTWLHRVVANSCVGCLRRGARRKEQELLEQVEVVATEQRYRIDERQLLQEALQDLSDDQRTALLLIDCEGYSYREVADMFDTTAGTVGSWLSRARTNMRRSEVFA